MPEKIVYNIISKYFDPRICSGINDCSEELIRELCRLLSQEFGKYYEMYINDRSLSEKLIFEHIKQEIGKGFEYNIKGGFE